MDEKGMVQTVTGPVKAEQLGVTLVHEHLSIDIVPLWNKPTETSRMALANAPVSAEILSELRYDPFVNLDNLQFSDVATVVSEILKFKEAGGQTVVDVTSRYNGRNPEALKKISLQTGINIVMGCGYYLEFSHPDDVKDRSIDDLVNGIVQEITEGVDNSGIRPGIIGEAGVGKDMTEQEIKLLKVQSRAQAKTGLPLTIHTHGWGRQCHSILDLVAEEGADLEKVILDHMNPSLGDFEYQASLAKRGAYLEYDMIGMNYYYPEIDGQSPSDEENARAIKRLIDAGFIEKLLLSQDVFLKMMLTRYGGLGYGHILNHFVPRLKRLGINDRQIYTLLVKNPQSIFTAKERST